MPTNQALRATWHPAVTHINAAIDGLLAPFRGADGNCTFPARPNTAELAAMDAVKALTKTRDQALSLLELATRDPQ